MRQGFLHLSKILMADEKRRASSSTKSAEAACVGLSGGTEPCGGDAVCLDQSGLRNLAFCAFPSVFVSSLSTRD